jgi:hypothetical protein
MNVDDKKSFRTLAGLVDSAESTSFDFGYQEEVIGNLGAWFPHIWVRLFECLKITLIHVRSLLVDGTSVYPGSGMLIEDTTDPLTVGECVNHPSSSSRTDSGYCLIFRL